MNLFWWFSFVVVYFDHGPVKEVCQKSPNSFKKSGAEELKDVAKFLELS